MIKNIEREYNMGTLMIILVLLIQVSAAIVAILIHEIPKYMAMVHFTHPIHRKSCKLKISWIIDPIGLILMILMRAGWQKPLNVNINKLRDRQKALLVIGVSGIVASLISAIILFPVSKNLLEGTFIAKLFVDSLIYFNINLFIINLVPVLPLDMTKIIYYFSPTLYFNLQQNARIGQSIFIILLMFDLFRVIISGLYNLMAGIF